MSSRRAQSASSPSAIDEKELRESARQVSEADPGSIFPETEVADALLKLLDERRDVWIPLLEAAEAIHSVFRTDPDDPERLVQMVSKRRNDLYDAMTAARDALRSES